MLTARQQAGRRRVKLFLADQDKTQGWLAQQLGVSESTISSILRGHHEPSLSLAFKLAKLTGADPTCFVRRAQPSKG